MFNYYFIIFFLINWSSFIFVKYFNLFKIKGKTYRFIKMSFVITLNFAII